MRKRIFAVVMAVVVAVGCVGYRPQKAYANAIALSSEGFEVLFGLLGSAGVVVGIDKTVESRFEEGQKLFDSLSSSQQQSYIDWLAAGKFVTSDTGHRVFQPDMELDTSFYRGLWQSVSDVCSTFVSYAPPVEGLQSYSFPSSGSGDFFQKRISLGNFSDSPFFVRTDVKGNSKVYALLPSGFFLSYTFMHATGSIADLVLVHCPADSEIFLGVEYSSVEGGTLHYAVSCRPSFDGSIGVSGTNSYKFEGYGGISWGNLSAGYYSGNVYTGAMGFYNGLAATDELIPCDTWVSKWDDAKAEGRQVGIITGQDLSGYNTLDDIYNPDTGLVTGLDIPAEIPVTPDLTGIAGVLSNILSWLKSLPRTIVGQGALDFSKFNNIALSGVFPFCIPFDLINVFKSFNGVQPIEPKWVIDLSATPLKAGGQIVLDLTQFGVWVSIIRYFCYASFVVGLILITRKVIKG